MRASLAAALLALAALGLPGCWALEELDRAEQEMDRYSAQRAERTPAAVPGPAAAEEEGPGIVERVRDWWREARPRPSRPDGPTEPIVACRLPAGLRFTHRSDCLARGGEPG